MRIPALATAMALSLIAVKAHATQTYDTTPRFYDVHIVAGSELENGPQWSAKIHDGHDLGNIWIDNASGQYSWSMQSQAGSGWTSPISGTTEVPTIWGISAETGSGTQSSGDTIKPVPWIYLIVPTVITISMMACHVSQQVALAKLTASAAEACEEERSQAGALAAKSRFSARVEGGICGQGGSASCRVTLLR